MRTTDRQNDRRKVLLCQYRAVHNCATLTQNKNVKFTYDWYVTAEVGVACVISRIKIPAVKASKIEVSP